MLPPMAVISGFSSREGVTPQLEKSLIWPAVSLGAGPSTGEMTRVLFSAAARASPTALETAAQGV